MRMTVHICVRSRFIFEDLWLPKGIWRQQQSRCFFCFCKSFPLLFHLSGQPSRRGAICVGVYPLITLEAFRIWFLKRALTVSSDHVLLLLFHPSHSFFSLNCFSEIETIRFFIFTYLSLYFIGFITTFTFHIIVVLVFLHMYTPRLFLSVYHVFCQIQHP